MPHTKVGNTEQVKVQITDKVAEVDEAFAALQVRAKDLQCCAPTV